MNYQELKQISQIEAMQVVSPPGIDVTGDLYNRFPRYPEVIVFGAEYWRSYDQIVDFITKYVQPENERDIAEFFQDIVYRICSDPVLDDADARKNLNINYKLVYKQHSSLYKSPDALFDWADSRSTFLWYEYILPGKRKSQFQKIIRTHDEDALIAISRRIKRIYKLSDREITYLQYFCSQAKREDLDPSLNTFLYIWSNEKFTGKTTVSEYVCSFLNGETTRDASPYKSDLSREMQIGRFDIPAAISCRCTMLDEAGFHDMTKTYDKLKSMITKNSCEIEYKYRSSKRPKRCYRNYIMSSNNDPIYFVKDDSERRILPINFTKPERVSFEELEKIWHEFVSQCNFGVKRMTEIYENVIHPNSQAGEYQNIISELKDVLTPERMATCNPSRSYFSISNVMSFPEVRDQRGVDRKMVKEALVFLYGQPDKSQRFYKINRHIILEDEAKTDTMPF